MVRMLTIVVVILAKTKPSYTAPSPRGGQWTVLVLLVCTFLSISEFRTWLKGTEKQHFSVEKGISHDLQLNLDIVVHMSCDMLDVNIQDASGDRILAGQLLKREPTSWQLWMDKRNYETYGGAHEYQTLSQEHADRLSEQEADAHVHHVLGEVRRNPRKKFAKGPKLRRGDAVDSCRIYGSLEGNKVQGDFHITARGHGYHNNAPHLEHKSTFSPFVPGYSNSTDARSLQLLAHDHRALLRPSLSHPPQPPRQNHRHNRRPLLQVPVFPLHRANHLLQGQPRTRHLRQRSALKPPWQKPRLHQPVRGHQPVQRDSRKPLLHPRPLLQVQHRAHPAADQRGAH